VRHETSRFVVGQETIVELLLTSLVCKGHCLLVGVPGLAKTLLVATLGKVLGLRFQRIQFTPDLMPTDIVGSEILQQGADNSRSFQFVPGPIFANLILADEVNRAPAKVQSALLESMAEKQVTIGDETHQLDRPFMVMATQNPVEQEGTYPLPEAQVDRFMMKVIIGYPTKEDEKKIIRQNLSSVKSKINPILKPEDILKARNIVREVYMDEKIEQYIVDIVFATRYPKQAKLDKFSQLISFGGSPRASINLALASKAYAFIKRRGYVIPEDVRAVCHDVLRHRIGLTYEAEAENIKVEDIINEILNTVEVP
jgi:MoxR-like ATPase